VRHYGTGTARPDDDRVPDRPPIPELLAATGRPTRTALRSPNSWVGRAVPSRVSKLPITAAAGRPTKMALMRWSGSLQSVSKKQSPGPRKSALNFPLSPRKQFAMENFF
jgi:hypothetical protein